LFCFSSSTFFFFGIAYGKKKLVKKVKGGSESVRICKQNAFGGRRNGVRELVFLLAHRHREREREREVWVRREGEEGGWG
jgi:hypothetical protein